MYYKIMETTVRPDLKLKTFFTSESLILPRKKVKGYINIKFYQKLFVVLMSLSTFLIFPESPKQLEDICEIYNPEKLCNVW